MSKAKQEVVNHTYNTPYQLFLFAWFMQRCLYKMLALKICHSGKKRKKRELESS